MTEKIDVLALWASLPSEMQQHLGAAALTYGLEAQFPDEGNTDEPEILMEELAKLIRGGECVGKRADMRGLGLTDADMHRAAPNFRTEWPRRRGFIAGYQGIPSDQCPYASDRLDGRRWVKGWGLGNAARMERMAANPAGLEVADPA